MIARDPPEWLSARYDVIDRLDDGSGDKEVSLAADREGGPDVVIVRIPCGDHDRLAYDIARLQRIDSPYVPRIFGVCQDPHSGHHAYVIAEFCEGPTLAQVVSGGALAVDDAAPYLVELARGLAAVHAGGVLHRDLKLDNAMLVASERGPQLKLLDLGLAARLEIVDVEASEPSRGLARMLPYMPREVVMGRSRDPRIDVYALGVCCFRILTGEFPLPVRAAETVFDYLIRIRDATADLAQLPAELPPVARAIIERMLDRRRERRPFVPEVVAVLERAFGALPLAAAPPIARPRPERP